MAMERAWPFDDANIEHDDDNGRKGQDADDDEDGGEEVVCDFYATDNI